MSVNLHFLFRHLVYATTFFAACALLFEALVPGSVTPFLDPLPFVILGLTGMAVVAMRPKA